MKRKCGYVLFGFLFLLTACSNKVTIPQDPLSLYIDSNDSDEHHTERLAEKETPYTVVYKNEDDSYSLYIFSSPISFYNEQGKLELIDNSISKTNNKEKNADGYIFENKSSDTKIFFPKDAGKTPMLVQGEDTAFRLYLPADRVDTAARIVSFTDVTQSERDAVSYQKEGETLEIKYIPTSSGITAEIVMKEKPLSNEIPFKLDMDVENIAYATVENQYTVFYDVDDNEDKAVIYPSFLSDSNGRESFDNAISILQNEDGYDCTLILDQDFLSDEQTCYPLTITPSFGICRSTMADAAVYSEKPTSNAYLADYAVLGYGAGLGTGEQYWRFRINYIFKSYEQNVKSAVFSTVQMSKDESEAVIGFERLMDIWIDSDITWNSKYETVAVETTAKVSGAGRYHFDITNFVKNAINDDRWLTEVCGLLARGVEGEGYKIFATSDNTLSPPYIRIDFYDLPWTFEKVRVINPEQDI